MKLAPSNLVFAFAPLALVLVSACSGGEGDACSLDRDCSSGLVCCRGAAAQRGFCGMEGDHLCGRGEGVAGSGGAGGTGGQNAAGMSGAEDAGADDAGQADASTTLDASAEDAATDAGAGDGG